MNHIQNSLLPMKGKENPSKRKMPKEEVPQGKPFQPDRNKQREDKRYLYG